MIPKGNQRGGGQGLATHLLNAYDNDRVEVAELRGAIAADLHGAFAEWYAQAKATKCRKYLYSLSINPDHTQGPFTREHYYDFIRRTEKSLALSDQARAVVFHVKHGREHCHVVWSRIDTDRAKAVQMSLDHQKLRAVAQEYARDHNITLPPGMRNNRGKDRFPDHEKTENLGEKQQEERTGISKKERREQITKLLAGNPDPRSFVKALEDNGYTLATGERRAYVIVDLYGEIHSLSRQLTAGDRKKDLLARMPAVYPADKLPSAEKAQHLAREKRQALLLEKQRQERERTAGTQENAKQRREALRQAQGLRRAELETKRQQLTVRHSAERKTLSDLQSARTAEVLCDRAARHPKGIMALLSRVTGFNALTAFRESRQDKKRGKEYSAQSAALARRHDREMESFQHQQRGLDSLDKRERRSLETGIRRDVFRAIAAPAKTRPAAELTPEQQVKADKSKQIADEFRKAASTRAREPERETFALTEEQRAKIAAFKKTAEEISAPAAKQRGKETLHATPEFNEAAAPSPAPPPAPSPDSLSAKFKGEAEKTVAKTEKAEEKKLTLPPETPLAETAGGARTREIKQEPPDLTPAQRKARDLARDLAREFNERAGQTGPRKDRDKEGHDSGDTGREKHYRRPPQDFSIRR